MARRADGRRSRAMESLHMSPPRSHSRGDGKISRQKELSLCQALYGAYQSLCDDTTNARSAFHQILQAGSGGAGQQRLAARLISRFAQYFPSDFERSVQVLTVLTKSAAAETAKSSTASAILQDALKGLGATTAELCKLSPGHNTLQQTTELLFRLSQPSGNCPASKDSNLESSSAAAGLCALFKACARPCCLICLQLLNRHDDQLSSAVCTFLHQQLFAPAHKGQTSGSDPDLESDGSDQPSLAEAAFVQPDVVEVLRQSAEGLSGDLTDAAHWQKLLEQLVAQLAPPLATHKPAPVAPPSTLSSPEHASSDMIISPPPVPLASHLSPHRKQSPVRSRGSPAGRSPAGSSPRLLALGGRVQKRSASTLRPRGTESPSKVRRQSRNSPASSGSRRSPPRGASPSVHAAPLMPSRSGPVNSGPDEGAPLPRPGLGITAVTRCIWFGGLPPDIAEADLFMETSRNGEVQFTVFPDCPRRDEALVTFASFRGALTCWENMNNRSCFGSRPLMLRFCPSEPSEPRMDRRYATPPPAHVYVPDVAIPGREAAVFRSLDDAHAPRPEHSEIIHSNGAAGLLMRFSRPAMVPDALHALVPSSRPDILGGTPGGRYLGPSRGSSPLRSLGRSPPRTGFDRGAPEDHGRGAPSRLGPAGGEHNQKTLWIGQLSSDVSESELVDAFRAFGTVLDRTVMRNTKCAYIDFEDAESATQARRAMNGAFLGGTALRVEFKGQHSNSAPPRRDGFSSPPRGRGGRGGRLLSPRGRSRGSRAPPGTAFHDQRPSPSRFGHGSSPSPPRRSPRGGRGRHHHPSSPHAPYPAYPESAPNTRPSSPGNPPPATLPSASRQVSAQQASKPGAAAGHVQDRTRGRDSDAAAPDEQPNKRPRANKWDQQEPDPPAADVPPTPKAQAQNQHTTQSPMQQAPSPPPPLPLQSPPPLKPPLPGGAPPPHHLPPHLAHLAHQSDPGPSSQVQHEHMGASALPPPVPMADPRHASQQSARNAGSLTAPQLPRPQLDQTQSTQLANASATGVAASAAIVRAPPSLPVAWRGQLAKSGVVKCRAECLSTGPGDASMPWPKVLDVNARVVVARALEQAKQHAPQQVVIRCVVSIDDAKNQQHFHHFCEYLTEKQRAGVIKSDTKFHTMFLIPGCHDVFQQLQVPDPQRECLVAVTILRQPA